MAYTMHGHHIEGSGNPVHNVPRFPQRCGGTEKCATCRADVAIWLGRLNRGKVFALTEEEETPWPKDPPILKFFEVGHLPPSLAAVSLPFKDLAALINQHIPNGPEKDVALRKLLEAKDAAVRASLDLI